MSDKRFELDKIGIFDNKTNHYYYKTFDNEEVEDLLNELSEEKEYFGRKKEYFLSKWSIANAKNIQLRQEIKELEKENEQLKKARDESDKFIVKKGLEIEFLEWCMK